MTEAPAPDTTQLKPLPTWTREERIAWALAKFGADAPFYWNIYQVGARGTRSKLTEVDGLEVEAFDDEIVQQFGGGRYFRQLMVRNVRNDYGSIVSETVNLSPALGRLPVLNPPAQGVGAGGAPTAGSLEERLVRIERALDRFAGGMPAAAPDPTATMRMAMEMAQMMRGAATPPTPVEELLKVKALAEKLIERDEARDEGGGFGDYRELGRLIIGVVNGIREALPRPAAAIPGARGALPQQAPPPPAAHPARRVGGVVSSAPVPEPDDLPHVRVSADQGAAQSGAAPPTPQYLREPFPGCFDIVDAVKQRPELIPITVGKDPADDCADLINCMFDKIEEAAGDPRAVANRLGARGIVDAFVSVYPDAEPFRAMMERAAAVFVEAANDEGSEDDDGDASADGVGVEAGEQERE